MDLLSKNSTEMLSTENLFWKILQNLQEMIYAGYFFYYKKIKDSERGC